MIKTAVFISLASFAYVKRAPGTIVISIGDVGDKQPCLEGFAGSIRLEFVDLYEEAIGAQVGDLPDLHPQHASGARLFFQKDELPDYNDASKVNHFLAYYAALPESYDLVVHCQAGISRSAAVAQFAADRYNAELIGANPDTSAANRRLLRLFNKVADGVPPSIFMPPDTVVEYRPQEYAGEWGG